MKAGLIFAVASLMVIALVGALLALVFRTAADHRAILTSAGVAWVVQLLAFATARMAPRNRALQAWGLGAALRFSVLLAYALLALRPLELPATAALISLAAFFFVSTLIETRLLSV